MSPSPPLSLSHPDWYMPQHMADGPATLAAAAGSYTGISFSGADSAHNSLVAAKPEKKRRRPALSCEQCRRRKIRCDRGLPCTNCVKSKITPCTYAPTHIPVSRTKKAAGHGQDAGAESSVQVPIRAAPVSRAKDRTSSPEHFRPAFGMPRSSPSVPSTSGSTSENSSVDALMARVRQLEEQLANNVHISPKGDHKLEDKEEPSAPMKGTVSKTRFFGQSHWMNGADMFPKILQVLTEAEARKIEPYGIFIKCKALGRVIKEHRLTPLTSNKLGESIPDRGLADQLVDAYFENFEGGLRILHVPTFRAEYERYWQNPSAASFVFIMQMQLCMAIGATLHDDLFCLRSRAVQWVHETQLWLLMPPEKSRMTIAGLQVMCLIALAKATCAVGQDLIWVTTGAMIRQAMYMGLHRDPRHLGDFSVYRSEMRRRIWATIMELNLQTSFDAGGPPLISAKHYDTLLPANLNDDQLTDEPDNRRAITNGPETLTDMSVQLALLRSLPLRLAIIKHVNEFRSKESYPETLRLSSDLTKACRTLTETLASLAQAQKRNPRPIINQFHNSLVQMFLYRCFICLHQPMLARVDAEPTFYYSRKVSLDCSLKMAQICGVSSRTWTPAPPGRVDPQKAFDRLVTNASGVFRVVPTQTLFAIALELIKKREEQQESLGGIPAMGTRELCAVLESALLWTERRIRSGETNIKGHCFTAACIAHADAIEKGLPQEQADQAVIDVGTESGLRSYELLKELAEKEGVPVSDEDAEAEEVGMEGVENMDALMETPYDWMGDFVWDSMGGFPTSKNTNTGVPRQFDEFNQAGQLNGVTPGQV